MHESQFFQNCGTFCFGSYWKYHNFERIEIRATVFLKWTYFRYSYNYSQGTQRDQSTESKILSKNALKPKINFSTHKHWCDGLYWLANALWLKKYTFQAHNQQIRKINQIAHNCENIEKNLYKQFQPFLNCKTDCRMWSTIYDIKALLESCTTDGNQKWLDQP